jgi:hypothetical protein
MPLFQARASAFLADNEPGNRVKIRLGDATFTLKRSRASGHFEGRLDLPAQRVAPMMAAAESARLCQGAPAWLSFRAITRSDDPRLFDGRALLVPPQGVSVISDIDDTIKVTEVFNRRKMLHNTFLKDFSSVPEMAPLYRRWETEQCAAFHYVSASPWQLYAPLADFIRSNGFPAGVFYLKSFRCKDESFFNLFEGPEKYKPTVIEPLIKRFPNRKFVFVGDSGEKDPEIYGALAREHPQQVAKILIRNVTEEGPEAERYKRAFRELPDALWKVFREPEEIVKECPEK